MGKTKGGIWNEKVFLMDTAVFTGIFLMRRYAGGSKGGIRLHGRRGQPGSAFY